MPSVPNIEGRKLQVMLSSRVTDDIGDGTPRQLVTLRHEVAEHLRAIRLGDSPLFDVWLSEEQDALAEDHSAWDHCMMAASSADIVVVIYTGKAGWSRGELGICHAEFATARNANRRKVRVIRLATPSSEATISAAITAGTSTADGRFYEALTLPGIWMVTAGTYDDALASTCRAVAQATIDLARAPMPASRAATVHNAQALVWERLPLPQRAEAMQAAFTAALRDAFPKSRVDGSSGLLLIPFGNQTLAFRTHAVPGPFSDPDARSAVGRPFDQQSSLLAALTNSRAAGPIELVAVQRGVTETQIRRHMGAAGVAVAGSSFGFLARRIDGAQVVFFKHCLEPDMVRRAVGDFFSWMDAEGLASDLVAMAERRLSVLRALN